MSIFRILASAVTFGISELCIAGYNYEKKMEAKKRDSESDGWRHTSTKRREILADDDSDDGAHFTFTPALYELHATFGKGNDKKHSQIDIGLGGLTQWETLKGYGGLEKTTELRYAETKIEPPTDFSDSLSRRNFQLSQPEKSFKDEMLSEYVKKLEKENREKGYKLPESLRCDFSKGSHTPNSGGPFDVLPGPFDVPSAKHQPKPLKPYDANQRHWLGLDSSVSDDSESSSGYPFKPNGSLDENVLNQLIKPRPAPILPLTGATQTDPIAEYWKNRAYGEEAARIQGSMNHSSTYLERSIIARNTPLIDRSGTSMFGKIAYKNGLRPPSHFMR